MLEIVTSLVERLSETLGEISFNIKLKLSLTLNCAKLNRKTLD